MIKHRFIVRGADDFKIFAAIPSETQVLTWKKWMRPPDWEGLRELEKYTQAALAKAVPLFECCADCSECIARLPEDLVKAADPRSIIEDAAWRGPYAREAAKGFVDAIRLLDEHADERARQIAGEPPFLDERAAFIVDVKALVETCTTKGIRELVMARDIAADNLRDWSAVHPSRAKEEYRVLLETFVSMYRAMINISDVINDLIKYTIARSAELCSSEALPDTPCPPGTPFASYTIEFKDAVFNIVEGYAWLQESPKKTEAAAERAIETALDKLPKEEQRQALEHVRDTLPDMPPPPPPRKPTDDEKRVVEIVTQMLVERGLNPKAPERIPVVEVDSKHANHTREAEKRDDREGRAPKVRTIKFNVAPPRYLREAVERILATPGKTKKAHWVIGHWRNQACGIGHKEHRQQWIKPHIRGLGEAGAVVVRVAASDEEVAARADS